MRSWLNSSFLNKAFSASEQAAIKDTEVVNEDNPEYGTEGGNDTTDKVYLLSLSEAKNLSYGFPSTVGSTATREAVNTEYVAAGGEIKSTWMNSAGSTDHWWLRSPGDSRYDASAVFSDGDVTQSGYRVFHNFVAARPALHLNLSSTSSWSYAGTVTSERKETGIVTSPPAPTASPTVSPVPTALPSQTAVPTVSPVSTALPSQTAVPTVSPVSTASPAQTAAPAGNVSYMPNQIVLLPAPAQDISGKVEEDGTAPAKVTALKLKAKKKALQASWKKVSGAFGYEIWCSTSKKFKKKSVKTTKKTKITVGKLKAKKAYFVKVRAYTVKNGKKVYGAWSKAGKKKTK